MKHIIFLLLTCCVLMANAQQPNQTQKVLMNYADNTEVNYVEVSDELFKMIAKREGLDAKLKHYMDNLSSVIMLEAARKQGKETMINLYTEVGEKLQLSKFKLLMLNSENGKKYGFYKKAGKDNRVEYLLVSNTAVIYMYGSLTINSISDFQQVCRLASSVQRM
ncbi:DUF4252 domain-containing protein [Prolixibacteraceae bacterium JC049]|nr:DUF4252 domain-containing protein [Prolixibacteraceae bacterium JC049]